MKWPSIPPRPWLNVRRRAVMPWIYAVALLNVASGFVTYRLHQITDDLLDQGERYFRKGEMQSALAASLDASYNLQLTQVAIWAGVMVSVVGVVLCVVALAGDPGIKVESMAQAVTREPVRAKRSKPWSRSEKIATWSVIAAVVLGLLGAAVNLWVASKGQSAP